MHPCGVQFRQPQPVQQRGPPTLGGRCLSWQARTRSIRARCLPACSPALQAKYNVMEALVYLGPFTFGILAAGAYVFEWEGLCTQARTGAGQAQRTVPWQGSLGLGSAAAYCAPCCLFLPCTGHLGMVVLPVSPAL